MNYNLKSQNLNLKMLARQNVMPKADPPLAANLFAVHIIRFLPEIE
ncbi:MAG: hypothetical protein CEN89_173 [Candidatus Berkelbacteria bacterium Licking1014_7]|uniref:Uncharacterized protein n=1 Tax=Candidatus Berkelbacteria bacterium Licking1014_7 TaxID=2017147 RepID=A0A554LKV2_9BACT|nr:MAG: hypothetical protein CEN89_173 [Candidatus Berkelbacteria bacterium Licking1014_7]